MLILYLGVGVLFLTMGWVCFYLGRRFWEEQVQNYENDQVLRYILAQTQEFVALVTVDEQGELRLENVNNRFFETHQLYGVSVEKTAVIGKPLVYYFGEILKLSAPEIDSKFQQYRKCLERKEVVRFQEQTRFPGFGEVLSETTVSPILDTEGEVVQLLYFTRDLTQELLARKQIQAQSRWLEESQRLAKLGFWQWDTAIDRFTWSPEMFRIFDWKDTIPPNFGQWQEMADPRDQGRFARLLEQHILEPTSFSTEIRIQTPDQTEKHLRIWGDFVISEQKEVREIYGICLDITEQKAARKRNFEAIISAEERTRKEIAIDLHDGLGQGLSSVSLHLNSLTKEIEKLEPLAQRRFQTALHALQQVMQESREIAYTLSPPLLQDYGYVRAMEGLIRQFSDTGTEIQLIQNIGKERYPEVWERNLFRITQEAIHNSIQHGKAKQIVVQLIRSREMLSLQIEDDGIGFSLQGEPGEGLGLRGIKTRAEVLQAELIIDSFPEKGTTLSLALPMNEPQHESLESFSDR